MEGTAVMSKNRNAVFVSTEWPLLHAAEGAMIVRGLKGDVDVRPIYWKDLVSKLDQEGERYKTIYVINLELIGDVCEVERVLRRLQTQGVRIEYVSNILIGRNRASEMFEKGLISYMTPDGRDLCLHKVIAERYGVETDDLYGQADVVCGGDYHVSSVPMFKVIVAAVWFSEVYGRDDVYERAVKAFAGKISGDNLLAEFADELNHYEMFKHRELIGREPVINELRAKIRNISKHPNVRVLILGESGTGKETVAMQIHYGSERRTKKFVPFNCATVNVELVESRLFGYEPGAFTGALNKTKRGLFEEANGGTLFLDEIGELRLDLQGVLLRVLEEGRIMRVGGNVEIPVDVRVVCATNKNLPEMVRKGLFREDLYQRLSVAQLRVPALREHLSDIPEIAYAWYSLRQRENSRYREPPKEESLRALLDYDYPGNVRELLNLLERAEVYDEMDFAKLLKEHKDMNLGLRESTDKVTPIVQKNNVKMISLEDVVRRHINEVYCSCGRCVVDAAKILKVSRNTVRKYLNHE